jgi:hypothetical protein
MPQDTPERDSMTSIRLLTAALPALALAACGPDEPATGQAGADPEAEGRGVSALAVDPNAEAELVSWRDLLPDEDLEMYMALEEGRMEVLRVETDLADSAYAMAVRSIQPYDG